MGRPTDGARAPDMTGTRASVRKRSLIRRSAVVGVVAAFVLTGCTWPAMGDHQPQGVASYYNQTLQWKNCGGAVCANVSVPLDWAHPSGAKISIALAKVAALGSHPLGTILYDPGGPGASGTAFVKDYAEYILDPKIRTAYNLVGFDSRGVGQSTAVKCLDQNELSHYYFDLLPTPVGSPAWVDVELKVQTTFAKACEKNTGPLLTHLDTASAARDLDVVRAALGDRKLDYFGVSYGTKLGLEYAGLFPKNVGRFVLDGVLDPDLTGEQITFQQDASIENVTQRYLASCVKLLTCPFTGTVADADDQLAALFRELDAHPAPASDGRKLNAANLATALIAALYSPSTWMDLNLALVAAKKGEADQAFAFADNYLERGSDGTYPNLIEVYEANNCDDYDVAHTPETMAAEAVAIDKIAPVIGRYLGYSGAVCSAWPSKPAGKPVKVTAKGSGPILLVSSTNDPATPLIWAQSAAGDLADGHLITRNGDGHGSYNTGNDCIDGAVDAYWLHGTVPPSDPKC